MSETYEVGDRVVLKSGGPVMTITEVIMGGGRYRCKWFAGSKVQSEIFPEGALDPHVEDDDG